MNNSVGRDWVDLLTAGALTATRLGSALLVNKIIAVYLGPAGLAIVGQFNNFMAVVFGLTSGGMSNAVISTVAQAETTRERAHVVGTAAAIFVIPTSVAAVVVAWFAPGLSVEFLGSSDLSPAVTTFAICMIPIVLNVIFLSAIAGSGGARSFAVLNALAAIVTVPVCWQLSVSVGLPGALVASAIVSAACLVASAAWLSWSGTIGRTAGKFIAAPKRVPAQRLARLAAAGVTTVFLLPAAQMGVRGLIIDHSGLEQAGHWQAAAKIGEILLMIAMLYVSTRALPAIAQAPGERFRIAIRGAVLVMSMVSAISVVVLALDTSLVSLLFNADFSPVQRLLGWQLAGDTLRSGVIVIQAAFIGAGRLRPYVATDVLLALSTVGATSVLVASFGPSAGAIAATVGGAVTLPVAIGLARRLPQDKSPL